MLLCSLGVAVARQPAARAHGSAVTSRTPVAGGGTQGAPRATGTAPGAPGAKPDFAPADKHGFGTSTTPASKVWFTLEGAELTEIYYPRLDTPSFRDLQFVVTDGHSLVETERDSTSQRTVLVDPRSLTYRQVNTDKRGRWRLTKTYVTDPGRAVVVVNVVFQSLTGHPYRLYLVADPQLSNNGAQDSGHCSDQGLIDSDGQMASAILTQPALTEASCGFKGTSDGLTDLLAHHRMAWHYASAPNGNVVQLAARRSPARRDTSG